VRYRTFNFGERVSYFSKCTRSRYGIRVGIILKHNEQPGMLLQQLDKLFEP